MLHMVRSVVREVACLCGFGEDEVQFIVLAVDEACANVIRHAYQGRHDGGVQLMATTKEDRVEFVLVDQGQAPQPGRLKPRSLDEIRPGGLGLHLIQSVMDEVRYHTSARGNELFLAKMLQPRPRVETGAATE